MYNITNSSLQFWVPFGIPIWLQIRPWNAPRANSRPISPSWRVPGRVPEGLWEIILGTFLRLGWRQRKKGTKSANKHMFLKLLLHAFSYRFRVYSVRLGARRRKSTTSKTASNHWFLWWNLRMRHLRAQHDKPSNRTKVEQNTSQKPYKKHSAAEA